MKGTTEEKLEVEMKNDVLRAAALHRVILGRAFLNPVIERIFPSDSTFMTETIAMGIGARNRRD